MLQQALYSIVNFYAYATLSLSYTLFVLSIVRLYVIVTVTPQLPATQLPSSASADSASAESATTGYMCSHIFSVRTLSRKRTEINHFCSFNRVCAVTLVLRVPGRQAASVGCL